MERARYGAARGGLCGRSSADDTLRAHAGVALVPGQGRRDGRRAASSVSRHRRARACASAAREALSSWWLLDARALARVDEPSRSSARRCSSTIHQRHRLRRRRRPLGAAVGVPRAAGPAYGETGGFSRAVVQYHELIVDESRRLSYAPSSDPGNATRATPRAISFETSTPSRRHLLVRGSPRMLAASFHCHLAWHSRCSSCTASATRARSTSLARLLAPSSRLAMTTGARLLGASGRWRAPPTEHCAPRRPGPAVVSRPGLLARFTPRSPTSACRDATAVTL